jgi:hypothetical protein
MKRREKMKRIALLCLLVSLMATVVSASVYPLATGNWNDPCNWSKGAVPPDSGDEIKLLGSQSDDTGQDFVITVDQTQLFYTTTKIDTARGSTLYVTTGGYIGNGREMHIGDAGASGNGSDDGFLLQDGGTVDVTGKLQIGYKAHAVDNAITGAKGGLYTISGGTLTGTGGRMYVACSSADGSIGAFQVVGSAATISLGGAMYVANDSTSSSGNTGAGTIQFDFDGSAVSKIQVDSLAIDSQDEAAAVATLIVNTASMAGDTVLIESTGSSSVVGKFDYVIMNGVGGRYMYLGSDIYFLSYTYDATTMTDGGGNDVALVLVPEPATLVLLAIGGLIASKRRK